MSRPVSKPGSEGGRNVSSGTPKKTPATGKPSGQPKVTVTRPPGSRSGAGSSSTRSPTTAGSSSKASTKASSMKSGKKREKLESEIQLLSPEEVLQLRKVFAIYDKDAEGVVSTRELKSILRAIGYAPTEGELQDMIHEQDSDGDGYLSFHDFAHLMVKRKMSENTEDELLQAFRVFDRDRDGHITAEEMRKVMQKMGDAMTEEEIDDMIIETDVNGDGEIDYNEFLKMMLFQ